MTVERAKQIGSNQALISVAIGILIAQLIMTWLSSNIGFLNGFMWFISIEYKLNLVIGILVMLLCGHLCGQQAGFEILIKKKNYLWVGIKYGFLILILTAFISSWTGFFQEGINNLGTDDNPFIDYIIKPMFWISSFGIIPVLFVGLWFGWRIKKQENKTIK